MKIKNLIIALSAIGSMFTASLFAQTSENKLTAKNEVSISVDDVFAKNRNNNVWNVNGFETQFATMLASPKMGLGCKYHFQTSAMRTKISYAYNSSNFNDQDVKTNKTYSLGFIASIGYEIQKKYDNVQLFYGVDAVETVVDFNAKTQYETTSFDNQKIDYSSKSSGDYFSIGLSPFLGIKYFWLYSKYISKMIIFAS